MTANPAFLFLGLAVVAYLALSNKRVRFWVIVLFVFFFGINLFKDNPAVVMNAFRSTVQPVTNFVDGCMRNVDAGEKTCPVQFGAKK